jgi:hypothetical protein
MENTLAPIDLEPDDVALIYPPLVVSYNGPEAIAYLPDPSVRFDRNGTPKPAKTGTLLIPPGTKWKWSKDGAERTYPPVGIVRKFRVALPASRVLIFRAG